LGQGQETHIVSHRSENTSYPPLTSTASDHFRRYLHYSCLSVQIYQLCFESYYLEVKY